MNESKIKLTERLRQESRWEEASSFRDTARADFRSQGMARKDAVEAAWQAMAEAYPPLRVPEVENDLGPVQGLSNVPADWLPLPANAALSAELGWVQANRLSVVEEKTLNLTVVNLDRAHEPAPSRAALGWLETSIRSYAKSVDVVAKCLKDEQDEAENVRRERMQIDEIRELLAEMHMD